MIVRERRTANAFARALGPLGPVDAVPGVAAEVAHLLALPPRA